MNDEKQEQSAQSVQNETVNPQKSGSNGVLLVLAIAFGNILLQVVYMIWDAVDGYSVGSEIVPLIFSIVTALLLLTGMPWVRYLFAANAVLSIISRIISLVFLLTDMDFAVGTLVLNIVILAYFVGTLILLLVNRGVKNYFTAED